MQSPGEGRQPGLAARLLAAQGIVVLMSLLVVSAVAALVGPPLFHEHLAGLPPASAPAEQVRHAEQAYRSADLLSLLIALPTALFAAALVGVLAARRITRPLAAVTHAASAMAAGHYDVRVPTGGIGAEFDRLAGAFNDMAGRLRASEQTRLRLLSDLGHELRTPVATLDAYLEALEDGVMPFDADTAAVLRGQTARLARLAEDISAVSRAEEGRLELRPVPTTARELVDAALAAATARFAAKEVALRSEVAGDCPAVRADPGRMGQVLGNLLENALRHTPPGGAVVVTARPGPFPGPGPGPRPGARPHGDAGRGEREGLVLSVRDTGEGIAAEHLPHIFERFYRGDTARDREHGGSGIGLTIAKALAEAHGGRLTAASTGPGCGATFTVTLPAAPR